MLSRILRAVCPWATDFSPIISRHLDGEADVALEADLVCYVSGDTLAPCCSRPEDGVSVAVAADAREPQFPQSPLPHAEMPLGSRFSPTDASREGPHKYCPAGAYSGLDNIGDKVAQLETLIAIMLRRWCDRTGRGMVDVTQLVGAAALILSCDIRPRRDVMSSVQRHVRDRSGDNLKRLVRAGRVCVIVLDKSQSLVTCFQRAVAGELGLLNARLRGGLQTVHEEVRSVHKFVSRGFAQFVGGCSASVDHSPILWRTQLDNAGLTFFPMHDTALLTASAKCRLPSLP